MKLPSAIVGLLFIVAACFPEPAPVVAVNFDTVPPNTTTADSVEFAGQVVRLPPLAAVQFTLRITGGQQSVTTTVGQVGLFSLWVQLNPQTTNTLVVSAQDDTGAQSEPWTFTVVQELALSLASPSR
jgi:hypothetical protein